MTILLCSDLMQDGKEIVFLWVPGHASISGNSAAESAAKDAPDGDISVGSIPVSDLKPRLNNYLADLRQNEWCSYSLNNLHKISPHINEFSQQRRSKGREENRRD